MFIDSAFDLQFVILHKGLVPPSTFGEGVIMCFPGNIIIGKWIGDLDKV